MRHDQVKISEIANFVNGYPFKPSDWGNKGLKIIRIQNLTDHSKPYNFTTNKVLQKYIVKKGDILVSWSATIDVFEWIYDDAYLNQHIFKVEYNEEKVNKEYFKFALKKTINDLTKFAHGSTMKHVVKGDFERHKIPLPSINDQIRIADILSRAESLIARRKESIRLLDEYVKSMFLEMFGPSAKDFKLWPIVEIKDLAAKHKGSMRTGPFGSNLLHSEFTETGDVAVLGIDNAVQNVFAWKVKRFISIKKYSELQSYRIFPEDVIITIMGTTGRSAVVPMDIPLAINTKHLAAITLDKEKANPYFLSYSIHSNPYIVNQLTRRNRGAIMNGLNLGLIKETKIHQPPIEFQNDFALIIKKIEAIKSRYKESLSELENLYGSLSQRAFRGEI